MTSPVIPPIYKLHIWIRQISPMIGRRILVRSESSIAQLHDVIQIAFSWSDSHLHRFRIHGRDYGIRAPNSWMAHDLKGDLREEVTDDTLFARSPTAGPRYGPAR